MKNKVLLTPIFLMISLLATSFAYAHWYDEIVMTGQVETGELDWEFTFAMTSDPVGAPDMHIADGFIGPPIPDIKNVGTTHLCITPKVITVTIENAYPCYFTMVSFYYKNTGTIPLIMDYVEIAGEKMYFPGEMKQLDLDGDGLADVEIWWRAIIGLPTQLHPGEDSLEHSFWFHVLQPAPENSMLRFTITLSAVNWNEYIPPI